MMESDTIGVFQTLFSTIADTFDGLPFIGLIQVGTAQSRI